jgi:hypothetical protein
MKRMETELVQPTIRKIALPNKKYGIRINLEKLFEMIKDVDSFKPQYDKDSNPCQNWVEVTISGKAKFFSNGTVTTNLNLPDEALIELFDKFYKAYIKEVLE